MTGSGPIRIGVLGGGQLGRMLGLAGIPLGCRFRFLDPAGADAPAAAVGEVLAGAYDDPAALEVFARDLDLVTWEFENVPVETARWLAERVPVHPPPQALEAAQDRWVEKETLRGLGIPVAATRPVESQAAFEAACAELGLPAVLKTRRLGYDGKGQRVIRTPGEIGPAWEALGRSPLVLEAFVPFRRELSLLAVRGEGGEVRAWPLVENVHREGILRTSLAPAEGVTAALQAQAEDHVRRLLEALDYVGVLAVEFFETDMGLVANEIAPRVHNSGHWTQDGARTSQFENHVRAIAGLPLGSTDLVHPDGAAAMVNFIGTIPPRTLLLGDAEGVDSSVTLALHHYDKEPRPGRKVGHLNLHAPARGPLVEAMQRMESQAREAGQAATHASQRP